MVVGAVWKDHTLFVRHTCIKVHDGKMSSPCKSLTDFKDLLRYLQKETCQSYMYIWYIYK